MGGMRQARFRQSMRSALLRFARKFGATVKDENGRLLGRALIIPFRGRIHVIGLETPVRLVWSPQARLTYWKQEIQFAQHAAPDFPKVPKEENGSGDESPAHHT